MLRIILSGCNGTVGRVIDTCVKLRVDCTIAAGIDPNDAPEKDYSVFASAAACTTPADVIIDFSHPAALGGLVELARVRKLPLVVATTGLSKEQVASLQGLAQEVPVLLSANMSIGVNLLAELVKVAAHALGKNFDIEIIERHHNKKIDAPSGTALMLADAASTQLDPHPQYVYDRHSKRSRRTQSEIGIHAVRGGTIVGEHEVVFAGQDEVLSISHSAASKEVFAVGAINAAQFLSKQPPGMYSMKSMFDIGG
jgi:dihydrodipicolinate reductase